MGKWKELALPDDIHTCHADCQNPACIAVREAEAAERKWQGLTDEEMEEAMKYWSDPCRSAYGGAEAADDEYVDMIGTWRYIEAKLKEKNND